MQRRTDLAEQVGAPDAANLGRQLHLIYDGAGVAGRMDHHDPGVAPAVRDVVQALLDAALTPTGRISEPATGGPRSALGES
jgi:hypothetical protein